MLNLPVNFFLDGTRKTRKSGFGYTKSVTTTIPTLSFLEKKIRRIPRKGKLGVMGDKNRWKRVHHLYSVIPSVNQFIQMIHRYWNMYFVFERGKTSIFLNIDFVYVTRFTKCLIYTEFICVLFLHYKSTFLVETTVYVENAHFYRTSSSYIFFSLTTATMYL